MSTVNFREAGDSREPSPAIWADCPNTLLVDLGKGYFRHHEFLGGVADTVATGEQRPSVDGLNLDCDDDTVLSFKASELGGYQDIETDGDDNDAAAIFSEPFAKIDLNSGNKVWFETRLELGDVAMDGGLFAGLAEEAALDRDVIADDAGSVDTESMVGFQVLQDDPNAVDFIFRLDAGTVDEMDTDITNDAAIASADQASLVNDTEVKLGFRFDGKDKLAAYVNGVKVHEETLDTDTFPDGVNMGAIIGIKTGAAAAESVAIDWVRYAYQER